MNRHATSRWAFGLAGALALLLGAAPARAQDYAKTPVLMIHGTGLDATTWTPLITFLQGQNYPPAYLLAINLSPVGGYNGCAATDLIAPAVEQLLADATTAAQAAGQGGLAPTTVDLVGHSMGAVSTRWYATKLRPDRVRTWIALTGANHGTNTLCAMPTGGGNIEMCPAFATSAAQSDIQVLLNGTPSAPADESPYGLGTDPEGVTSVPPDGTRAILYYTVRIDPDTWITPADSALLAGAGGPAISLSPILPITETSAGTFLFTGAANHDNLPQNPNAMQLVFELLAVRDGG